MKNVSYRETNICRRDPLPKSGASLCTQCCYWRKAASPETFSVAGIDGSHWVQDRDYTRSGKNIYKDNYMYEGHSESKFRHIYSQRRCNKSKKTRCYNRKQPFPNSQQKSNDACAECRRREREQQTSLPEFSLVQISLAERRVLTTWSQMEVRAVVRYE
ncbi:hypothetical protein AVEN_57699-1 [Araneus ventricosus]|uniref:Uncharacterized protein n=1 Tax=Araneus ventricosus TaxID=182803 RepID=A0A4Y2L7D9_ARAVE|nr:hypothetical protein AVEN_59611-1 [Araneus ventricosus]GBN10570.1 hypothetical protein AVEN_177532-1 [Araneus ventricosus]GBN16396.1 hypothetical protein AVEN_139528-1 [Araneus ventricosus]GBN16401.1 hypothetical protein AVEN_57699-1 [Araneus ventricosus]